MSIYCDKAVSFQPRQTVEETQPTRTCSRQRINSIKMQLQTTNKGSSFLTISGAVLTCGEASLKAISNTTTRFSTTPTSTI